jgi:cystathionine beta-lyase/cystathionine gamma-synthase
MTEPGAARRRFPALPEWTGVTTRLVHGARRPDWNAGAVTPPVYLTSTFHYPASDSEAAERGEVYMYSRLGNPTVDIAAEMVRDLEGAEEARVFASGMGAISSTILSLVRSGDTVVGLENLYGGTTDLMTDLLPRLGVRVHLVPPAVARTPEEAIPRGSGLAWIESPTNPTLGVVDIGRWARAAHAAGALLVVDNTFATPINQNPLALGADLVVHSATKYLGGHADLIAGAVVGSHALLDRIDPKGYLGASADPFVAFLLARSLKTLPLRVARQNQSGRAVAKALRDHPAVRQVHYPGWSSPEEEGIAARQMRGRGGMVSLTLRGGAAAVRPFLRGLRFVQVASSLGGVESLVSVPGETSHRHLTVAELSSRGIDPGLVRVSVGLEEPEDLVRDLTEALDRLLPVPTPSL